MSKFTIDVSYSQLAVFKADIEEPFNDWNDQHVAQGFAWRAESVSFGTLDDYGPIEVEIHVTETYEPTKEAVRAIRVPFSFKEINEIEIASIADGIRADLESGDYDLIFETGKNEANAMWARLSFVQGKSSEAKIIVQDDELNPGDELLMEANIA